DAVAAEEAVRAAVLADQPLQHALHGTSAHRLLRDARLALRMVAVGLEQPAYRGLVLLGEEVVFDHVLVADTEQLEQQGAEHAGAVLAEAAVVNGSNG